MRFTIHEIDDVPGYQWELISHDAEGEVWPEEYATLDEVFARIRSVVDGPQPQPSPVHEPHPPTV